MAARKLDDLFVSTDSLAALSSHTRVLARLQRCYAQAVPAPLAKASRVVSLKQGVLVIYAESGAVAARLSQLRASLLSVFVEINPQVTEISVRVQAPRTQEQPTRVRNAHLPDSALDGLSDLAHRLPNDDPLRAALERLTKKVGRKTR